MFKATAASQKKYEDKITALQKKVFQSGGKVPGQLIEKANENTEALKDEYGQLLELEIQKLTKVFESVSQETYFEDFKKIYALLHDIRGEAGTFDYILLSHVANETCGVLNAFKRQGIPSFAEAHELLAVYFRSILLVYSKGPKSCYGKEDQQLIAWLRKVRAKYDDEFQ